MNLTPAQLKAQRAGTPLPRKESEIQGAILDYLKTVPGVVAWRTNSGMAMLPGRNHKPMPVRFGFKGISDIVGWADFCQYPADRRGPDNPQGSNPIPCDGRGMYHAARFLAIEVKRPGKEPTDEQRIFLYAVRKAGGLAIVATNVEDVAAAFNPK